MLRREVDEMKKKSNENIEKKIVYGR